jgi:hypothetical protein
MCAVIAGRCRPGQAAIRLVAPGQVLSGVKGQGVVACARVRFRAQEALMVTQRNTDEALLTEVKQRAQRAGFPKIERRLHQAVDLASGRTALRLST